MQFERLGYFCIDRVDNTVESIRACGNRVNVVTPDDDKSIKMNRVVTLKDTWAAQIEARDAVNGSVKTTAKVSTKNDNSGSDTASTSKTTAKSNPSSTTFASGSTPPTDDILRVELRVGKILSAERHPDADSLFVEQIDCGDSSGIGI